MDTYTLEPGRWIYRNGKPFVYVTYGQDKATSVRTCEPVEADAIAREIVRLLNSEAHDPNYVEIHMKA